LVARRAGGYLRPQSERAGRGFAPQDIAAQMGLSVRTVETYLTRILTKLDLGGRRELRQRAVAWVQRAG
jgi:DNA-binding CsgD family transcriptional regulator